MEEEEEEEELWWKLGWGGWNNNNNNNNDDERFSQSSSMATRFLLAATVTFLLTVVPLANAKSLNAAANKMKAQNRKAFQSLPTKAKDFFTSMLYGFVIFYGVKMALKSFFAPVALFSFTMCILHNMKVLPFGPMEMYESWVRPYLPRVSKRQRFPLRRRYDFGKYTKAFWSAAHRILPACDSSHGEKALILGMLLAGLCKVIVPVLKLLKNYCCNIVLLVLHFFLSLRLSRL